MRKESQMRTKRDSKTIRVVAGIIGGAILSTIVVSLVVAILELHIATVWPAIPIGAVLGGILSFVFPRVVAVLIEFIG